ncbi:MAG: PIG-L family deacetylase [Acidobacteria bacterium]|nr:PIG-L family deacetylase [Acidobacteriota bacterium]
MSHENKNILAFMAHPDDAEFLCAGTLARLKKQGYQIHIATMTAGDGGSTELPNEEIARIRYNEAEQAAALLNADYLCAHQRDFFVTYGQATICAALEIIRRASPILVITHSPQDYMTDHEQTSMIVRAACFAASAPNAKTLVDEPAPPLAAIPHLYYTDAIEGKDIFGAAINPSFYVDISDVIETKAAMLACHASQRDWLLKQHGMDHYVESMKHWSAHRGSEIGVAYAEGFRQHLGHAYPQNDLLGELLGTVPGAVATG